MSCPIVPRPVVLYMTCRQRDAKSKSTQQHEDQQSYPTRIHRLPGQNRQNHKSGERH